MTVRSPKITRRRCGQVLAGALLGWRGLKAASAAVPHLSWTAAALPENGSERRYRADAQVLMLSLPLLHRANVGGGSAVWRESGASGASLRLLEFNGFSRPERAAGLNRVGFIREMARLAENDVTESIYFGLMTSSPEESLDDARKALNSGTNEVAYTAIDGHIAAGQSSMVTAHFTAPKDLPLENQKELVERARRALATAPAKDAEPEARGAAGQSFLEAVASLLRQPAREETQYVYGGRLYHLWLTHAPDPKTAAYFHSRGLISERSSVMRASGKTRRAAGGKETTFRLWYQPDADPPLPLRIEYQPKSYLRLVFEAEA